MYTIYAIYNKENKKIYIGQTKNMEERLRLHNEKFFRGYTSGFSGNWIIIYKEHKETRKDALLREKQLKSFKGREFIKKHIPA